ncbi:MAG TPA: VCBS repeat-containing protein [Dissulfurispiraceae bacterium]|nr:VCBS repeat-containing protein [Dissulfurispiraceae bacterium]
MKFFRIPALFFIASLWLFWSVLPLFAAEQAAKKEPVEAKLTVLKDDLLGYFIPVAGNVVSVQGNAVQIAVDAKTAVKPGMRLQSFKEGSGFVHPITREQLGRVEIPVGTVEVASFANGTVAASILEGTPESFQGAKVKVPATKRKILFSQGRVDWYLGNAYYQLLLDSQRFELIDTGLETDDLSKLLAEAKQKGAEAVVVLSSQTTADQISLTQKAYWAKDGKEFSGRSASVSVASVRELRMASGMIGSGGEILVSYRLPFGSRRLTAGDLNGDGKPEIVLIGGHDVRVYKPDTDLKLLWEFSIPKNDEVIWADVVDLKQNGRDIIALTLVRSGGDSAGKDTIESKTPFGLGVTSYLYELQGNTIRQIWEGRDLYLRVLGSELIAQEFDPRDGYSGPVLSMKYSGGTLVRDKTIPLPQNVNIYDFQILTAANGSKAVIAWDDRGFLNLFNEKGIRIWSGREEFGADIFSFKRQGGTFMSERGNWTVKDRLLAKQSEVLAPKRKALLSSVRGLGSASTEIRSFWWNGISLEDRIFVESMNGEIFDYAISGDRIYVIARPMFGINFKNVLKGENPFGSLLYVFSTKGK